MEKSYGIRNRAGKERKPKKKEKYADHHSRATRGNFRTQFHSELNQMLNNRKVMCIDFNMKPKRSNDDNGLFEDYTPPRFWATTRTWWDCTPYKSAVYT